MPTELEQRITNAKAIVLSVLAGRITPEGDPAAFDEDSVYLSVRIAEQNDPEWLLRSIAEAERTPDGLSQVITCMGPLRPQAESIISPGGSDS
jgi:hypothetical protein